MSDEPNLNTDVPHAARIYDYLLGGKDNFRADREAAAGITKDWPNLPTSMRANRNFMRRVGRYLAGELGIRQFLDVGTGLPTAPNLHDVVQDVDPEARVVYVDNDPMVLVHARALLTSTPEGKTTYLDADLRDPVAILSADQTRQTLDLEKPVALSLIAILQFVLDDGLVHHVIDELMAALPPGSALALSTVTAESAPEEVNAGVAAYNANGIPTRARGRAEVEAFFRGFELVEPGVALVNHWWPDDQARAVSDAHVHMYGGVAVKR
ncbi:MAG: SAM-dependent methyltransferase [Trebonia sp.]